MPRAKSNTYLWRNEKTRLERKARKKRLNKLKQKKE